MPFEPIGPDGRAGTVITGASSIELFRMMTQKSALQLEIKGIRVRRGFSAYAQIKREYGFKGSREKVLAQMIKLIETTHANRTNRANQEVQ